MSKRGLRRGHNSAQMSTKINLVCRHGYSQKKYPQSATCSHLRFNIRIRVHSTHGTCSRIIFANGYVRSYTVDMLLHDISPP